MPKAIKTISIASSNDEVTYWGLISQLKPYALFWHISQELKIQFKPLEYTVKSTTFPKYSTILNDFSEVKIFVNRLDDRTALSGLKNVDYIIKFENKITEAEKDFLRNLKRLKEIRGILKISVERMKKDKSRLKKLV